MGAKIAPVVLEHYAAVVTNVRRFVLFDVARIESGTRRATPGRRASGARRVDGPVGTMRVVH